MFAKSPPARDDGDVVHGVYFGKCITSHAWNTHTHALVTVIIPRERERERANKHEQAGRQKRTSPMIAVSGAGDAVPVPCAVPWPVLSGVPSSPDTYTCTHLRAV